MDIPSLVAERTTRSLMATLAQHRRQEAILTSIPQEVGRVRILPNATRSAEIRRHAAMVRMVSIVETFMANGLVARLEAQIPAPRAEILEDVYTRAEDAAISSWPKLTDHYQLWLHVPISQRSCPAWRQIEAMVNVRNAIAHGLGELTRRMARKDIAALGRDFATIDVEIVGTALLMRESSLRKAAFAGREFVNWLDGELAEYDDRRAGTTP